MANSPNRLSGTLLSPARIGDVNRSRVIQALCDHGPMSRADLAKMAGVTRATIGNIASDLVDAGLVEEVELDDPGGRVGKPARPLWFSPRAGLCGAATLAAGEATVALVNARGEMLERAVRTFDADAATPGAAAEAITSGLQRVLPRRGRVLGIGVAVPGVVDTASGMVAGSGQLPGVAGDGLVRVLRRRLGRSVLIDNDARAQALGEKWFGDGRGIGTFASVQTGLGLGVGLVVDGVVYRGRHGDTGELGHTCVQIDGPRCRCGLSGCWETIATLPWLRGEAASLGIPEARTLDAGRLVALAGRDGVAAALLDRYAVNLAVGLATLVQLLDPQRVILHGDAVSGGEPLRALIDRHLRARVLGSLAPGVDLVLSPLDQHAGLLGAAGLVLSDTFSLAT